MATGYKLPPVLENLAHKKIDLSTETIKITLSATAPDQETPSPLDSAADCVLGNVSSCTGIGFASGLTCSRIASEMSGDNYILTLSDITMTATGGNVGPFRYIYFYVESVADDYLLGYWDNVNEITIANGQTWVGDFGGATNIAFRLLGS